MNRVFIDMDGVIVDFDKYKREHAVEGERLVKQQGIYLKMEPIPGALEAVRSVISMGYDVWIATKPPTGMAGAYADKAEWIFRTLPELKRKIIITHDKGLLGDSGDYLLDDRPHAANCEQFKVWLMRFIDGFHWEQALTILRKNQPNN
ncbi:MAG: hypothetical protein HOD58_06630 [Gammaproteobacteria bacterium]|jgi:5'(3')-deoxyribonucleotidase|nr:hypothetical protein [Candidatus Neomarinimicrobiota bacterium]MBT4329582.1 hypothetical protein [Gammaproteobacteria bacterium]MBT5268082.1 hypothetical protein [Candidatus Neomarinimicrobiota bacterium]